MTTKWHRKNFGVIASEGLFMTKIRRSTQSNQMGFVQIQAFDARFQSAHVLCIYGLYIVTRAPTFEQKQIFPIF